MKLFGKNILVAFSLLTFTIDNAIANPGNSTPATLVETNLVKTMENHENIIDQAIFFSDNIVDQQNNTVRILKIKGFIIDNIDNEISRINKLNINKDDSFVDSAVTYYETLKRTISEEYDEVIRLRASMDRTESMADLVMLLENADHNLVDAENKLYRMESIFCNNRKIKIPAKEIAVRKKVLQNESVIKYHNKLMLMFYNSYSADLDIETPNPARGNSELGSLKINLAEYMVAVEDSIDKLGPYEGDGSIASSVKSFLNYLRVKNFHSFEFYYTYVRLLEEKKNGPIKNDKEFFNNLKEAHSRISRKAMITPEQKEKIVENIDKVSANFLSRHSPKIVVD